MSASWVRKLLEDNSRLHKEEVLRQALSAAILGNEISHNFIVGLRYCYNPYITFGVKQIPESIGINNAENPWDEFFNLLFSLHMRTLTGFRARDAISDIMNRFDSEEWNLFLAPILRRDMRCGITEKTINKVMAGTEHEIPTFSCQLATNSENQPELSGVKRLEPKLDGVRTLILVQMLDSGAYVTCYSRNGKIFENFKHIEDQILSYVLSTTGPYRELKKFSEEFKSGFVLDGEIVSNSFQKLMRQTHRKENVNALDSVFYVFDIIPAVSFSEGHWNAQQTKRNELLNLFDFSCMENVEIVPYAIIDLDTETGKNQLHKYANDMVSMGYEGIMIKNLDAPYECTRNKFWLKWKPTITVDLQVVGVEAGTGRNSGRLGALICNGIDNDKEITVNVGSGFSDQDRIDFWNDRELVIGRTVEILADAITQNIDGAYSLRFPRFLRFRDDK